jgi:hypothetical protein
VGKREGKTTATAGDVENSVTRKWSGKFCAKFNLITAGRFEVEPERRDMFSKMSRWYLGLEPISY